MKKKKKKPKRRKKRKRRSKGGEKYFQTESDKKKTHVPRLRKLMDYINIPIATYVNKTAQHLSQNKTTLYKNCNFQMISGKSNFE